MGCGASRNASLPAKAYAPSEESFIAGTPSMKSSFGESAAQELPVAVADGRATPLVQPQVPDVPTDSPELLAPGHGDSVPVRGARRDQLRRAASIGDEALEEAQRASCEAEAERDSSPGKLPARPDILAPGAGDMRDGSRRKNLRRAASIGDEALDEAMRATSEAEQQAAAEAAAKPGDPLLAAPDHLAPGSGDNPRESRRQASRRAASIGDEALEEAKRAASAAADEADAAAAG